MKLISKIRWILERLFAWIYVLKLVNSINWTKNLYRGMMGNSYEHVRNLVLIFWICKLIKINELIILLMRHFSLTFFISIILYWLFFWIDILSTWVKIIILVVLLGSIINIVFFKSNLFVEIKSANFDECSYPKFVLNIPIDITEVQ